MYREHLMDHFKNPRFYGELESPDAARTEKNPSCGDTVTFHISIADGVVDEVRFSGEGCAISVAAASMLAEELPGMRVEEMLDLIGVPLSTMRVKCGMLGLHTVKKALAERLSEDTGE